ncbi:MAG: hypothetical protein QM723_12560 [Myxococcaceae bacterium]
MDRAAAERRAADWALEVIAEVERHHPGDFARSLYAQLTRAALAAIAHDPEERPSRFVELAYRGLQLGRAVRHSLRPRSSGKCFALLLPRNNPQLIDHLPIAAELERLGHQPVIAVQGSFFRELAGKHQVMLLADSSPAGAVWESAQLSASVKAVKAAARSKPLEDIAPEEIARRVGNVVSECLPLFVDYRRAVAEALDRLQPHVVVVGNANILEGRVAIGEARARGIRTVALQHGSILAGDHAWRACQLDAVLAWGDRARRTLIECGLAEEQVRVTGCPRMDGFFASTHKPAGDRVLVASSGAGHQVGMEEHLRFIETVYAAAERTPELTWVAKLHRKDSPALYVDAAAKYPKAKVEVVNTSAAAWGQDIFEWLEGAAALVTVVSTTALEAIAIDIPAISVQPRPDARKGQLSFLDACRVVCDADGLVQALADARGPKRAEMTSRGHALRDTFFAHRGTAALASAQAAVTLVESTSQGEPGRWTSVSA